MHFGEGGALEHVARLRAHGRGGPSGRRTWILHRWQQQLLQVGDRVEHDLDVVVRCLLRVQIQRVEEEPRVLEQPAETRRRDQAGRALRATVRQRCARVCVRARARAL